MVGAKSLNGFGLSVNSFNDDFGVASGMGRRRLTMQILLNVYNMTAMVVEDELLTVKEFMELMKITARSTIFNWMREKKLKTVRLPNGHLRIPRSEYDRIVAEGTPNGNTP